jgi:hypothetical protein
LANASRGRKPVGGAVAALIGARVVTLLGELHGPAWFVGREE